MQVQECSILKEKEDERVWKGEENLGYIGKSIYRMLMNAFIGVDEELYDMLWKIKGLPTTQLCTWKVFYIKITTLDNMIKRGM